MSQKWKKKSKIAKSACTAQFKREQQNKRLVPSDEWERKKVATSSKWLHMCVCVCVVSDRTTCFSREGIFIFSNLSKRVSRHLTQLSIRKNPYKYTARTFICTILLSYIKDQFDSDWYIRHFYVNIIRFHPILGKNQRCSGRRFCLFIICELFASSSF